MKGKDCLFGKCHGSSKEEREESQLWTWPYKIEGWIEAGLVEMRRARERGAGGKFQSWRDSLHLESSVCSLCICVGGIWDNERES